MTKIKVALVAEGCLEEIVVCINKKEAEVFCDGYNRGVGHYDGSDSAYTLETAQEYLKEMLEEINSGNDYYTASDFNITLFEACELLNRSKKSISRYIRRGLLHPEKVKSQQGTLEYRFSKADIEAFKTLEALNADETSNDVEEFKLIIKKLKSK